MGETAWRSWEEELFARGEDRGLLLGSRESLRIILGARFGTLPADLVQRIESTEDLGRLRGGIGQAAQITSLDQLQM
jgi:hypothetical protein